MNHLLRLCPFTGYVISDLPDPTPSFDGISYELNYANYKVLVQLSADDDWGNDSWVANNANQIFQDYLIKDGLQSLFASPLTIQSLKTRKD